MGGGLQQLKSERKDLFERDSRDALEVVSYKTPEPGGKILQIHCNQLVYFQNAVS